MSIFNKKLISFSFLIIFLFSFLLPTTKILAAEHWYYTLSSWDNMLFFSTEKECTESRSAKILEGIQDAKAWTITKCAKLNVEPPLKNTTENLTKYGLTLEELKTAGSSVAEQYWFISKSIGTDGTLNACYTKGPYSQANCTLLETSQKDAGNTIYQSCTKSTTKPIEPADCKALTPGSSSTSTETEKAKTETDYYPLSPLPGVGETCTADSTDKTTCVKTTATCDADGKNCKAGIGFAGYLNVMIKIFIGICAILAMIMIIMGGIQYMTTELISGKEEGKKKITQAVLGLILALGAVAILNTINPDLLDLSLGNMKAVTVTVGPKSAHDAQVMANLANNKTFKRTDYYNCIKTLVGTKYNHCILQAIIQIESGGASSQIIGHDENVTSITTISRKPFIDSGVKYSGATFTAGSAAQNDDGGNMGVAPNPTDINLGLDSRFSHSVGMFGLTFFGNETTECKKPGKHSILCFHPADNSTTSIKDVYNNTNNADVNWAINNVKNGWDTCKDPLKVFYYWAAGGSCKPTGNTAYDNVALQKKSLYDQCVAQDTDTPPVTNTCPSPASSGSATQPTSSNKSISITYAASTKKLSIDLGTSFVVGKKYILYVSYGDYSIPLAIIYEKSEVDISKYPKIINKTVGWIMKADGTQIGHGTVVLR
jgi:type IV secretory pathway VirB2 component (pilin)